MNLNYKCAIIADPNGDAWGFAKEVYEYLKQKEKQDFLDERDKFAHDIREHLQKKDIEKDILREKIDFACSIYDSLNKSKADMIEFHSYNTTNFPDGEYKTKVRQNVRGRDCFFIHDSNLDPPKWAWNLGLINDSLKNSSANRIIDVLPYLKFSRQDRKDESRVPNTSKLLADFIALRADQVLTIDVHNPTTQGNYPSNTRFDSLDSFPTVVKYLKKHSPEDLEDITILGPDEGSMKRIKEYSNVLGGRIAVIDKYRKGDGTLAESLGILGADNIKGRNVLIPDDIAASGTTLARAADAAKRKGAKKVIGYCTHGIFTKGIDCVADPYDLFLIGNTIKQPQSSKSDKIIIIPFTELIGEAIYRTCVGESLSELFQL